MQKVIFGVLWVPFNEQHEIYSKQPHTAHDPKRVAGRYCERHSGESPLTEKNSNKTKMKLKQNKIINKKKTLLSFSPTTDKVIQSLVKVHKGNYFIQLHSCISHIKGERFLLQK